MLLFFLKEIYITYFVSNLIKKETPESTSTHLMSLFAE